MAANVKRMAELIKELDVTPELDYKLEVIPIRYGKVEEIYDTLNSVVTGQSSGMGARSSSTRASGFRSGTGTGTGVGGLPGSTGIPSSQQAGSTAGGLRTGTGMTSPGAARTSFADRLRNVSSAATGGAQYNLLEDARIIPDMRSNSLLVYASREQFKMLTNIVAKIDTLLAQVLIESIILEIALGDGQTVGVSMVQVPAIRDWTVPGPINGRHNEFANPLFPRPSFFASTTTISRWRSGRSPTTARQDPSPSADPDDPRATGAVRDRAHRALPADDLALLRGGRRGRLLALHDVHREAGHNPAGGDAVHHPDGLVTSAADDRPTRTDRRSMTRA
jgi:hypothetical protein